MLERSLRIRRRSLGEDHPFTARSLRNLSLLTQAEGGLEEALSLLQQALAIERQRSSTRSESAASLPRLLARFVH